MGGTMEERIAREADVLERDWRTAPRWRGVERHYSAEDVIRLRGSFPRRAHDRPPRRRAAVGPACTETEYVYALGAMTGGQAVEMVKAGLKAIYLSGWQVAADANLAGQTYPDQSLYPANSVPAVVRRINNALHRADQIAGARARDARLDGADRGRRRSGLRRAAERVRADEVDDRGRRRGRALRGPAREREEVRAPRRQGARADRPVRPHADRGAARRRRARRADRSWSRGPTRSPRRCSRATSTRATSGS